NSFLGVYDRELDTDDEEIEFEEQFILRMPEGEASEKLREMVKEKGAKKGLEDVWFKFKDSRRAVFKLSNQLYSAKLVDLPSIIESQKTLDGKQMFKAADISQMLVVSNPISDESQVTAGDGGQGKLNIEDYIWPHGITPPLRHVRKRRYRKRISRRTIEIVEQEVERMLEQDQRADKVTYDIIEDADPDASDSEFLTPKGTPAGLPHGSDFGDGSQMGDGATPMNGNGSQNEDDDLAADLFRELEKDDDDEAKGDDDDEDEDDDEGSEADSEDEEAVEIAQRSKLLNEEIRDLEAAVGRKKQEISSSSNPIIKKRFEDALKKIQADLDSKLSARASVTKEKEKRK
ncbi:TAFII55 protein conserved region-domain-containing protein, partial [Mrakia frigida]|uniref:transcription initiation factor TFIID subunit 7 family protein n=1 Tax=Mrakia frigida TaxID=29902 RepID=UPI003FCBF5CA